MSRSELAIIGILGILAIIQSSLAPHFAAAAEWMSWLNLVNAAAIIIVLFEDRRHNMGWVAAFWGGIFLDMYSSGFFGFWIIILFTITVFIKFILKKYVRFPSFW